MVRLVRNTWVVPEEFRARARYLLNYLDTPEYKELKKKYSNNEEPSMRRTAMKLFRNRLLYDIGHSVGVGLILYKDTDTDFGRLVDDQGRPAYSGLGLEDEETLFGYRVEETEPGKEES